MKTLVIHPKDKSTDFLETVYKNIENKTVVRGGMSKTEVDEMIQNHDRVMMMGHGLPYGLMSVGQFHGTHGLIIDETTVKYLKEKDNSVFIWCNADQFVNHFKLKGFYSGMFISEVGEANCCGISKPNQDMVDISNDTFVNIISHYINEDKQVIHDKVTKEYGLLAIDNPVALYNNTRLYIN
jgi:hypothetical protein